MILRSQVTQAIDELDAITGQIVAHTFRQIASHLSVEETNKTDKRFLEHTLETLANEQQIKTLGETKDIELCLFIKIVEDWSLPE